MKITVLVDIQSKNSHLKAEGALSLLIEDKGKTILFDTGFSDIFLSNASKLNLQLDKIDYVILSHGHFDHTWGLDHLIHHLFIKRRKSKKFQKPTLIAHPDVFKSRYLDIFGEIGPNISKDKAENHFNLKLSKEPLWITKDILFLGEVPRINDFEAKEAIGQIDGKDDYVLDDSALAIRTSKGLVIVTGCSHSGICNICEYSIKLFKTDKIYDIIGGFHITKENENRIEPTINYLQDFNIPKLHPCHCIDFETKCKFAQSLNIYDVYVGLTLDYNKIFNL